MRPAYRIVDRVYLGAMLSSESEHATAWFDSPVPINGARAATFLNQAPTVAWGEAEPLDLAIVRTVTAPRRSLFVSIRQPFFP